MPGTIDIAAISAAGLGVGTSKRITATVNTTLTITPPALASRWKYLKISNLTADTWVSVGINEAPVAAPSANPGAAADWEPGYDVVGGSSEVIALTGTLTNIQLLSSASADVVLNLISG